MRVLRGLGLVALATLLVNCDGSLTAPECEVNHTSTLTVRNGRDFAMDILVDGSRVGTLGPGQSLTQTVAAGSHTVDFKVTNIGTFACTRATPNLAQCGGTSLCCGSC